MDTVLQGLTQSGLVQKLSETDNHIKRFTYDTPDNAPYRSTSKEEIKSYMGDVDDVNSTVYFKIPRRGYLNRMYLKLRVLVTDGPQTTFVDPQNNGAFVKPLGPEFFSSFFDWADISIGGKVIERLYAESVLFDACKMTGPAAENALYWMKGSQRSRELESDYFGVDAFETGPTHIMPYIDLLVPLNFSIFNFHKDSLDTNFLQNIEVIFKKREFRLNQATGYTRATLVCKYHEVHNHFRTQIRNANFERETSSLITTNSVKLLSVPEITQVAAVTSVPQAAGDFPAYGRYEYSVQMDAFVTDILVSFRKTKVLAPLQHQAEMHPSPSDEGFVRFILKAHGHVILDKQHWELDSTIMNTSSLDVPDEAVTVNAKKFYGISNREETEFVEDDINLPHGTVTEGHRYGSVLYRIPLGLFSSDEFLSGGLNFGTLTDIRLVIEGEGLRPFSSQKDYKGLEPVIVLRTKTITRIDGKTGSVAV